MNRTLSLGLILSAMVVIALGSLNAPLLAFTLPLVIYLGTGLLTNPSLTDIEITRTVTKEQISPGQPVKIVLTVRNNGSKLAQIAIRDLLPANLELVDGSNEFLAQMGSGEVITLEYTIQGKRGYYNFRNVLIETRDLLNIFSNKKTLALENKLFIQPKSVRLGRIPIRPRGTRVYSGYIPARTGGSGVEFFGVREYQHGDSLRWINWKVTARHMRKLYINEFEQHRVADVGIIVDARTRSNTTTNTGASIFEHSVTAAAAITDSFLNDGNRVGLLLYGLQLDWTVPGYGRIQRERILQALARAKPGNSLIFGNLDRLPTRLFSPNSQLVLVSPLNPDDLEMLVRLRARGYALIILSPDPISFELNSLDEKDETVLLATRLARLERKILLLKLRQAGIQVLNWNTAEPLEAVIQAATIHQIPEYYT